MKITIDLSDIEAKALAYVVYDPQEWINNVVKNRCRQAIDQIFTEEVARMTSDSSISSIPADKDTVVAAADIKTAKQRVDELQTEEV